MVKSQPDEEIFIDQFRNALIKVNTENMAKAYKQGKIDCEQERMAFELGKKAACEDDKNRVPLSDAEFMILSNKQMDVDQQLKLQKAWIKGYDTCKPPS